MDKVIKAKANEGGYFEVKKNSMEGLIPSFSPSPLGKPLRFPQESPNSLTKTKAMKNNTEIDKNFSIAFS